MESLHSIWNVARRMCSGTEYFALRSFENIVPGKLTCLNRGFGIFVCIRHSHIDLALTQRSCCTRCCGKKKRVLSSAFLSFGMFDVTNVRKTGQVRC